MRRSLAGRRIVVTQAVRQSGGLKERLEREGAKVLPVPTIEIAPPESYGSLDDALRRAADFDWLVVTSANAVRALRERLVALGFEPDLLKPLRCAAIGRVTAEALQGLGLTVDTVPERAVGEALAEALAGRVKGQQVLLVRAAAARDVVPEALTSAGADVTIVEAYRTVVPEGAAKRVREVFAGGSLPDAVVFTSGSTVTHLMDVLRTAGQRFPADVACVSIGPVTSAALRDAGLHVAAEANTATLDALVAACARLFG